MTDEFIVDGNGAHIPARGFGTFQLRGDVCRTAVRAAIGAGYRHVDTAAMYGNEAEVGEGVREGGVAREELFVTTKVWTDDIAENDLLASAQASLERLAMTQVDLLLIHWPNRAIPLESSIRGLCRARKEGLARYIGVSNFPVALLEQAVRLAAGHGEKLAVNQCEYHPRLDQSKVIAACKAHHMAFTSYSPLGRGDLVGDATIQEIAWRLGRKPSQVILRWHLQQGVVSIPRSSTPAHIAENFDISGFELAQADMSAISALRSPDGRLVKPAFAPDWDA
jgi:diketogulonate reductase-like aldo/keto reductase